MIETINCHLSNLKKTQVTALFTPTRARILENLKQPKRKVDLKKNCFI
jgi:hypothetical protein